MLPNNRTIYYSLGGIFTQKKNFIIILSAFIFLLFGSFIGYIKYIQLNSKNISDGKFSDLLNSNFQLVDNQVNDTFHSKKKEFKQQSYQLMKERILIDLSQGKFSELDKYLVNILNQYIIDNTFQGQDAINIKKEIDMIRADIAIIQNLQSETDNILLLNSFRRPDTLAAALIYAPISKKAYSYLNLDSKILAAVKQEDAEKVNLRKSKISEKELGDLLIHVNSLGLGTYVKLEAYDCFLYGLLYRIFVVKNNNGFYQPYQMINLNGKDDYNLTALQIQQLISQNEEQPDFSIDSMIHQIEYQP